MGNNRLSSISWRVRSLTALDRSISLIELKKFFSTRIMNTQLVESIIRLVNTLPLAERSLLKQRLLQDDLPRSVDLNASSGSIQPDQADRSEWVAALHLWTQALMGVMQPEAETESYVDYLEEKYR